MRWRRAAGLVALAAQVAAAHAADSRAVYRARCARCHGETGKGDGPGARALKVSPLVAHAGLAELTPQQIVDAVKTDPKHRGVVDLADDDLRAAAAYVKELAGNPVPPAP